MHKIVFYGLILLQFDNSNQIMQDQIQKLRQSSTVFEKPVILSGKVKTLTSSNYHKLNILLELRTRILLTNVYKSVFKVFFILSRS